jgi:hypothetical protein
MKQDPPLFGWSVNSVQWFLTKTKSQSNAHTFSNIHKSTVDSVVRRSLGWGVRLSVSEKSTDSVLTVNRWRHNVSKICSHPNLNLRQVISE